MNLNFLSPLYLFGLMGISVPILIHFLTRRQQKHQLFSAVHLLLESKKRPTKRSIPNRKLLLLIRCLSIALLSIGLANPIISFTDSTSFFSNNPSANVFILDDSYSMATQVDKKSYYNSAIEALLDINQSFPPGSVYSIVHGSHPSRVLQNWTSISSKAKKVLQSSLPSDRSTEIGLAIKNSLRLLQSTSQKFKRIYVLTDRDKNGWNEESFLSIKGKIPYEINIIDFSKRGQWVNRAAVEHVEVQQEFLSNSRIIKVKVKVVNLLKSKSISKLKVFLWINGKKQVEGVVDIPAQSFTEKNFSFPLQNNIPINGEVRIENDSLLKDNTRYFNYLPDQAIKILVVDGDPKTIEHQGEAFYLERALSPFSASHSNILPTLSTLAELSVRDLLNYSVVMLCNVRNLPFGYEQELEKFVMRGGALFITLGDQIDAKFYNQKLGNILPVYLKTLHQVDKNEKPFRFFIGANNHRVLKIFKRQALEEMEKIRFNSIYSVEPREEVNFTTPMTFQNDFPALIESKTGRGKVILFVSSIDRDWNNFPIQPTFLPWIQRWVKYSARGLDSLIQKELLVGEPFYWKKQQKKSKLYLLSPRNKIISLSSKGNQTIFEDTYLPGVYQLYQGPSSFNQKERTTALPKLPSGAEPVGSFTVNIDPKESKSKKISNEEIAKLLPGVSFNFVNGYDKHDAKTYEGGMQAFIPIILLVGSMLVLEGWLIRKE